MKTLFNILITLYILAFSYFTIALIWGFNPTDIKNFNINSLGSLFVLGTMGVISAALVLTLKEEN